MTVIYSQQGKPLRITTEDALWLARAVEAEGEPRPQVAQTLVNRWAWLEETQPGTYPTLMSLIRAYAQPVNPRWFIDGDLLVDYLNKHGQQQGRAWVAAELDKAWHRQNVHAIRGKFTDRTRQAVQAALYGPLLIERGSLHFGPAEGVRGNLVRVDPQNPVLYQPASSGGPAHALSPLFEGRPHAVLGFTLLAAGSIFMFARSHRPKKRR